MLQPQQRFMNTTTIRPPSAALLVTEGVRALLDATMTVATWPPREQFDRGDGHPVFVLPGLGAGDISTKPLRAYLDRLGYETHGWKQGINFGPRSGVLERLVAQLIRLAAGGTKVSVIGWSLGGVYARYLALQHPELVRQVITLGSPFAGNVASATNAGAVYRLMSGETVNANAGVFATIKRTPSVPTTSVSPDPVATSTADPLTVVANAPGSPSASAVPNAAAADVGSGWPSSWAPPLQASPAASASGSVTCPFAVPGMVTDEASNGSATVSMVPSNTAPA